MSIHVTPIPSTIQLAAPSFTLTTANAAGAATTAIASDSDLLVFDATLPDAITFSQSGSAGSATVASRRDHAHAMEAESYIPTQADQSALEDETNENTYAPPDLIKYSPGVEKAWASFEQIDAHGLKDSYNVDSVTGDGAGVSDWVWSVAFANANYVPTGSAGTTQNFGMYGPVAGTLKIQVSASSTGTGEDTSEGFISARGTQV